MLHPLPGVLFFLVSDFTQQKQNPILFQAPSEAGGRMLAMLGLLKTADLSSKMVPQEILLSWPTATVGRGGPKDHAVSKREILLHRESRLVTYRFGQTLLRGDLRAATSTAAGFF